MDLDNGDPDDAVYQPHSPWSQPPQRSAPADPQPRSATDQADEPQPALPDWVRSAEWSTEDDDCDEVEDFVGSPAPSVHPYPEPIDAPARQAPRYEPALSESYETSPDEDPFLETPFPHSSFFDTPPPPPAPTADEFSTRRTVRPREWAATTGVRAAASRGTFGLIRLRPSRQEEERRAALAAVRRAFGGLRQVTVVNPKGGAGKTVATLMLGATFGQVRGGFVLAWDNNETQGTLGMRAQPVIRPRTVRDLLRDLDRFSAGAGRVGELAAYVRAQEEVMFDVLASDESATAGEMLTARAFRQIREVVGQFYKMILVDTGNNVRAENWQAALDATDQLVITMSARNDSAETAARLLDHLDQTGRQELVRRAVAVVTMPPHRKDVNPRPVESHFAARCRSVRLVPYDKHLDSGAPVRYSAISPESRRAWLRVAAEVADGL